MMGTINLDRILIRDIDAIPGPDGWWKQSTRDTFRAAGLKLLERGLSISEIVKLLESLYQATSDEFGA
jgi:hypothetical protein